MNYGPCTRSSRASTGASRPYAAGRTTCVDDLSHGELPSSHREHAALHGAPTAPDIPPGSGVMFDALNRVAQAEGCTGE
jgi:hypothetical protein